MNEKQFRVMSNEVKQLYCVESVDGEMFSIQEVVNLLNEQQAIIHRDETSIKTMMSNMKKLEEENDQLRKEKEYYRKYALQYLLEYEFYSDNFLNTIKNIIGEDGVKEIKKEENKIIEALKKEGLYE